LGNGWPRGARRANVRDWGLALSDEEIDYLVTAFGSSARSHRRRTHDVRAGELGALPAQDFQCRVHRRRRAHADSLFAMIRATYARNSAGVLSAYRDNAAVIEGGTATRFFADPRRALSRATRAGRYPDEGGDAQSSDRHLAVSGAATGAGGEIRDEGATGIGAKPKAGSPATRCRI
jgi:phosphoribosylformylglycinamidine synthase